METHTKTRPPEEAAKSRNKGGWVQRNQGQARRTLRDISHQNAPPETGAAIMTENTTRISKTAEQAM